MGNVEGSSNVTIKGRPFIRNVYGGILVGKIVAQQADESVLTNGKIDYDKLQPIIFDIATMTYRLIGPVVGQAFHDGLKLKG